MTSDDAPRDADLPEAGEPDASTGAKRKPWLIGALVLLLVIGIGVRRRVLLVDSNICLPKPPVLAADTSILNPLVTSTVVTAEGWGGPRPTVVRQVVVGIPGTMRAVRLWGDHVPSTTRLKEQGVYPNCSGAF